MLVPGKKLAVFSIRENKGGIVWVRAGNAHVNKDGSLNVWLDVLPLDGKLHVREAGEKLHFRDAGERKESAPATQGPEQAPFAAPAAGAQS